MADLRCEWISHGSAQYAQTVALRRDILRIPLGLDFSDEELIRESEEHHLACYSGVDLVGCLILKSIENGFKMRQVAVRRDMQGKGVGRAMVEFCETWATAQRAYKITLHARLSAVPFYLSHGYAIIGDEFEEVGLPHLAMQKFLSLAPTE